MENKFFVGQNVWSPDYGYGEVKIADCDGKFPVRVNFDNSNEYFTLDGRFVTGSHAPTLFPADEIPEFYKPYAQDPRIGKWGYFWDDDFEYGAMFSKLIAITNGKFVVCFGLKCDEFDGNAYDNFSLEIPEHCK